MRNTTSGRVGVRKDFLEKEASVLRDEQEEQARAKGTPTRALYKNQRGMCGSPRDVLGVLHNCPMGLKQQHLFLSTLEAEG